MVAALGFLSVLPNFFVNCSGLIKYFGFFPALMSISKPQAVIKSSISSSLEQAYTAKIFVIPGLAPIPITAVIPAFLAFSSNFSASNVGFQSSHMSRKGFLASITASKIGTSNL